jgi:hypothetical protein
LKLIVLFTAFYATFMSVFIYLDLKGVHRLIEEEMKRTSVSFAKTLAFSAGGALSTGNTELLRRYVRMASEEQYVREIVVQDSDNVVIASTDGRFDGQILEDDISRQFSSMDEMHLEEVGTPPKDLLHQSNHGAREPLDPLHYYFDHCWRRCCNTSCVECNDETEETGAVIDENSRWRSVGTGSDTFIG